MIGALIAGLFSMIPFATLLLMFSFFVLVVIKKLDSRGLKIFGYIVVVLLWVSIVITVAGGSITAMARRSFRMSSQAQTPKLPMAYGAMQNRYRTQFQGQTTMPQAARQQAQGQVTSSVQAAQSNTAASQK